MVLQESLFEKILYNLSIYHCLLLLLIIKNILILKINRIFEKIIGDKPPGSYGTNFLTELYSMTIQFHYCGIVIAASRLTYDS